MISPPNLRWCFVVWFVTDAGWILLCAIFKTTSSCILRCCFSEPGRNGVGVGGDCQFICEHCLFWTAYGTSCKTLQDANSGESDFKWSSDSDRSPFEEHTSQYSREEQQGRPTMPCGSLILSLSPLSVCTTHLFLTVQWHSSYKRPALLYARVALIYRLIPHPAFLKGRLAIVSKSSSHNIILVLPVFTVSFCFLSQESCFVSI